MKKSISKKSFLSKKLDFTIIYSRIDKTKTSETFRKIRKKQVITELILLLSKILIRRCQSIAIECTFSEQFISWLGFILYRIKWLEVEYKDIFLKSLVQRMEIYFEFVKRFYIRTSFVHISKYLFHN